MISKEDAIILLDEYLELMYNLDPQHINRKAHPLSITENDYCWKIYECIEEDANKEKFEGGIGAGPYFIDKETADIFVTTSAPHIQFDEDYSYFKKHGQSLLDWFPLRIEYLEAKVKTKPNSPSETSQLEAKYETRASETKEYLLHNFKQFPTDSLNLEIRYKPIDGIDCLVLVNSIENGELNSDEKNNSSVKQSISLPFTGGFYQFTKTVMELKKWIRINQKKLGADSWIEITEKDWTKDFNDWTLVAHLTFE